MRRLLIVALCLALAGCATVAGVLCKLPINSANPLCAAPTATATATPAPTPGG